MWAYILIIINAKCKYLITRIFFTSRCRSAEWYSVVPLAVVTLQARVALQGVIEARELGGVHPVDRVDVGIGGVGVPAAAAFVVAVGLQVGGASKLDAAPVWKQGALAQLKLVE